MFCSNRMFIKNELGTIGTSDYKQVLKAVWISTRKQDRQQLEAIRSVLYNQTVGSTEPMTEKTEWIQSEIVRDTNNTVLTEQNDPGPVSVHWNIVNWWAVLDPWPSTPVQFFMVAMNTIFFVLHTFIYVCFLINHTNSWG